MRAACSCVRASWGQREVGVQRRWARAAYSGVAAVWGLLVRRSKGDVKPCVAAVRRVRRRRCCDVGAAWRRRCSSDGAAWGWRASSVRASRERDAAL